MMASADSLGVTVAGKNGAGFTVATATVSPDGSSRTEKSADGTIVYSQTSMHRDRAYTVPSVSSVQLPSGKSKTTRYFYNDVYLPDGRVSSFNSTVTVDGRAWSSTDRPLDGVAVSRSPSGRTATTHYDPTTLLTSRTEAPGLHAVTYGYDPRGRLSWVQVGQRRTEYSYDASGNVEWVQAPDGKRTSFEYDLMGRAKTQIRPDGTRVGYAYDAAGKLTTLITPSDVSHELSATPIGAPKGYTTPLSGSYAYEYDGARRLKSVTSPSGATVVNNYAGDFLASTVFGDGEITYSHSP